MDILSFPPLLEREKKIQHTEGNLSIYALLSAFIPSYCIAPSFVILHICLLHYILLWVKRICHGVLFFSSLFPLLSTFFNNLLSFYLNIHREVAWEDLCDLGSFRGQTETKEDIVWAEYWSLRKKERYKKDGFQERRELVKMMLFC